MRRFFTILVLLNVCSVSLAQTASRGFPKAQFISTVNFKQLFGGVMLLEAYLDTISTPLNFILDTGSGGISLDSSTCDEFKIPTRATDTVVSGIGGNKKVSFVFDKLLRLNTLQVRQLNFHVNDYSSLTGIYGVKIDGIIGYSILNRYILKINYEEEKIEFYSPGEINYPAKGHILKPNFSRLPIQTATVQDQIKISYPFYFDTGAGLALLLCNKLEADSGIIKPHRKPVITGVEGVLGRSNMRLTVSNKLKLGPFIFRKVPTYLYNDDVGIINYPAVGGLLGSEIFRRFHLIINYPKREIHLLPNKHFHDEFDYSYTGMNMYFTDGKILVDDVIPGSPADKAGFKVHDQIISVGTDVSQSMESYRTTLRAAGSLIKVYIRREEELFDLYLKIASIL